MRSVVALALFVSASHACNDGTPQPATPPIIAVTLEGGAPTRAQGEVAAVAASDPPPTPTATPSAASAGDAGADFYSCAMDSDCVAVPKATCCPNGYLEAVNKQSVEAYRSSVVCERRHRVCPQFRVLDRRQALCGNESHKCEMTQPDRIVCNGPGPNPHSCPNGTRCDGAGHCAAGP